MNYLITTFFYIIILSSALYLIVEIKKYLKHNKTARCEEKNRDFDYDKFNDLNDEVFGDLI